MDTGSRAAEARRLRAEEHLSVRQIQQRLGATKVQLLDWLRGIPPPDWTRRPNAKDDLRERALELRTQGCSVNDIALELGVAKSTAFQWVRHLPLDADPEDAQRRRREHSKVMTNAQWGAYRKERDARHAAVIADAVGWVGASNERELLLLGAVMYWCEGTKTKPWRADYRIVFTNSDPLLVDLFLRFVEALGVSRGRLTYRVAIHESADATAATQWWAERVGVLPEAFQRPTLKRHKAATVRHNVGNDYRGCLVIYVPRGRELYWRIEGIMRGLSATIERGGAGTVYIPFLSGVRFRPSRVV